METFAELLLMDTPTEYEVSEAVILNPLTLAPSTPDAIVTAPDITASLSLVAVVPAAIALFGPRIVSALSMLTFSAYVPARTLMVSPALDAVTAD